MPLGDKDARERVAKRVERDAELIAEIETAVTEFIAEVDSSVGKLRAKYDQPQLEAA